MNDNIHHQFIVPPWRRTELVIPHPALQRALPHLLLRDSSCGIARIRRHESGGTRELLIEHFELTNRIRGANLSPLADWCALVVSEEAENDVRDWIQRFGPRKSQLFAVIALGATPDNDVACAGLVLDEGTLYAVDGVRLVGRGMYYLTAASDRLASVAALDGDENRCSRSLGALGPVVFEKLRRATVTLVGAGRNGTLFAWEAAALGVGKLRIVDGDTLSVDNLNAVLGLDVRDVGRPKAEVLAERLHAFRPDMAITALPRLVTDPAGREFVRERADLLVSCVDNDAARLAVSLVARERLMVHLDIGTSVQRSRVGGGSDLPSTSPMAISGDVRLLLPGSDGGCVACVGSLGNAEDLVYDLSAPDGALRRAVTRHWSEERAGSLVTINSIAVGAGLQTWLDLLAARLESSYWHRLAWRPGVGLEVDSAAVGPADDCRFCHRSS
jgi:molybdopterin/thiamine biosynthesis adenylyltransferase